MELVALSNQNVVENNKFNKNLIDNERMISIYLAFEHKNYIFYLKKIYIFQN